MQWRRWRGQNKGRVPDLGTQIIEALGAIGALLSIIEGEMAACWEAMAEELRLLHCLLVHNLCQIEMTLECQGGQEEGELEVGGSGEAEESEEWAEEAE